MDRFDLVTRDAEVLVAVFGDPEGIRQLMLVADAEPIPNVTLRIEAVPSVDDEAAARMAVGIRSDADAVLFLTPAAYHLAKSFGGVPGRPFTFVPVSGGALYSALLRAGRLHRADLAAVSFDTLSVEDVANAYATIQEDTSGLWIREFDVADTVEDLVDFHRRARDEGATVAVTCSSQVQRLLEREGVATVRITMITTSIRSALRRVALLGSTSRIAESQTAVLLVDTADLLQLDWTPGAYYGTEDVRQSLQAMLLREAQALQGVVVSIGAELAIVTTVGGVARTTHRFQVAPLVAQARREFSIGLRIGLGVGRTAVLALMHARSALANARVLDWDGAVVIEENGAAAPLPAEKSDAFESRVFDVSPELQAAKASLRRLIEASGADSQPLVVDADQVAEMLGVSSRSARRVLQQFVDHGLAWRLPPQLGNQRGRPRNLFRLHTE